jgi:hypothetical protein
MYCLANTTQSLDSVLYPIQMFDIISQTQLTEIPWIHKCALLIFK